MAEAKSIQQPATVAFARSDAGAPLEVILPDGTSPTPLGSGVITAILGEGGASIVYEIWNEQLGVKRAVKLLRPNALPTWRERFATEIRITAQLRHPNIIEIHSVGEWNRLPYIEMERLDGCSLDKLLAQRGALPLRVMLAVSIMVCRALAYTHDHAYMVNGQTVRGILHRDLKPANILIAETGVVKLMDFGLATPVSVSMHTMEGTVVGSLPYMSPETLEGKKATTGSDLYAFGAVMYEMLTGAPAFSETNMADFMGKRMRNEYRPLRDFRRRLPARLVRIINRCMAFDCAKRTANASQLCADLERMYAQYASLRPEETVRAFLTNAAPKRTLIIRRHVSLLPLTAAFIAVIIVTILGYATWRLRRPAPLPIRPAFAEQQPAAAPMETISSAVKPTAVPAQEAPARVAAKQVGSPSDARRLRREPAAQASLAQGQDSSQPPAQASLIAALAKKYGVGDPAEILVVAVRERDYHHALRVYDSLPLAEKKSPQAVLCKMRALEAVGAKTELTAFALQNPLVDAEYFIIQARNAFSQRRYAEALALLQRSRVATAAFADQAAIEREALYYRALCLTAQHDAEITEQNRIAATDAWIEVKYALRNDQKHRYFIAANENIRRLNPEEGENR